MAPVGGPLLQDRDQVPGHADVAFSRAQPAAVVGRIRVEDDDQVDV
jgi:hypothetical protein